MHGTYDQHHDGFKKPTQFCLGIKILIWCIDPNGIENDNTVKYPHLTGIRKCEILIIDT